MRLLIVSLCVLQLLLGAISDVPSTPGPLPASKAARKSRWPCSTGCGLGYYGLSGTGLGGYSPYYGGLGGMGMNPLMTGGLGGMGMNPLMTGGLGGAGTCMDLSPQCATYAATGQCASNPFLIRRLCPISCGTGCAGYQYGMGGLGGLGGYGGMGGLGTGLGTYGAYNPMLTGGMYPGAYGGGLYGNGMGLGTGLGGLGTGLYGNSLYGSGLYGGGLGGVGLGRSIYETGIYRKPNADVPVTSIKPISDSVRANTPIATLPALPKRFY